MGDLPEGWVISRFEDTIQILDSCRVPINNTERLKRVEGKHISELYPYYGATGLVGCIDDFLLDGEYVLLGEDGAPFLDGFRDKAYIVRGKIWVNNHVHILHSLLSNEYICYYLNYINYRDFVSGTTRLKLTQSSMKSIPIILPPLAEQQRIVEKLDELFSKLDKGVETLLIIKTQLKIYRQAVLKWAYEGKLTSSEWEISILGKVAAGLKIGPFGTLLHKEDYISGGVPVINPKHMKEYKICNDDSVSISKEKAADLQSYTIYENDVLIARRGEMGRTAYVSEKENGWLCGTGSMIIRFLREYKGQLFTYLLSAEQSRKYLVDNCSGTTMSNLNEKIIKRLPMPQIPIEDQIILLAAIESRLSVCDNLEAIADDSLTKAKALRQSILKKAFTGQLVPQDPKDEPADKLLERIQRNKV